MVTTKQQKTHQRSPAARGTDMRENWTLKVEIDPSDKTLLRSFFSQEMHFYNALVEGFSARLRSFPEALLALAGGWEELFADLAERGLNLRRINKPEALPEALNKHEKLLFENGKLKPLTERTLVIMELAAAGGNFHPQARRALALEMLRFYRQQAAVAAAAVPVQLRDEQVYKSAPEILETVNHVQKRHVQLPRSAVKLKFDPDKQTTSFYLPYARKPITVAGDFVTPTWNLMIIRQAGDGQSSKAPWLLDLKKSPTNYLVKMLDSFNPYRGSSFNVAKTARSAL